MHLLKGSFGSDWKFWQYATFKHNTWIGFCVKYTKSFSNLSKNSGIMLQIC